jgi:hypothetical protein
MDTSAGAIALPADEPVWAPVPGPTSPSDGLHKIQGFIGAESRRKLTSQPSRSLDSRVRGFLTAPDSDRTET